MLLTRIVFLSFILALGACASQPSYVAADDPGDYGYHARKIADDRYRVNYNGSRNLEDARDYALLRAAELTIADGYEWFQVVDRETATTEVRERAQSRFGAERHWTVEERCGLVSCTRSARPTATWARMDFGPDRPEVRHSHSLEIVMGKGEMPEDGSYYDARAVMNAIYESI
ncbi:MAG: hypothetical protein R3176_03270 [Woeseiaceae bacterium]|nr:hypothetical protein [Woeseiaceae bacterium]